MVDPRLIFSFVERWHSETMSFHMSFGEMTITLHDVACLLHLPNRGDFYTLPPVITEEATTILAVDLLGVSEIHVSREIRQQKGRYYSQQWLFEAGLLETLILQDI
ncbi:hypothetical protein QL285_025597 [Trifolium repens]|nr:hypothetical protein QL285_025597 [Trifolium repens]